MKSLKSLVVLAALVVSTHAFAGNVSLVEGGISSKSLPSCGGVVSVTRVFGILYLSVSGNNLCSNIRINGELAAKSQTYEGFILSGYENYTVTIHSNSRKHSDTVYVRAVPPAYADVVLSTNGQRYANLRDCGGSVELKITPARQVNLVFRDVARCSNFDILSNNGESINYPNQKLGGVNQDRSGSFTLPKRVIDWGTNGVKVVVKSNTGKTADTILVRFFAF